MPTGIYDKYQVYQTRSGKPLESGTFFVLKAGDVLAVSALRSYANNCLAIVETDRMIRNSQGVGLLSDAETDHLNRLAQDALWTADQWEGWNTNKLPD